MTKTLTASKPATVIPAGAFGIPAGGFAIDPAVARAEFFAHLELLELTMVVPQAAASAEPINKY